MSAFFFFFFFKKLTALREQYGMSENELASIIGVHNSTIRRWERNDRVPINERIRKMADFFGITTDDLIMDEVSVDEILEKSKIAKYNNH